MHQVAWCIICDAPRTRRPSLRSGCGEKFAHVTNPFRAPRRARLPGRIILQEMGVRFHHGAAPRGVHGDHVRAARCERGDIGSRECACRARVTRMRVQRATATLARSVQEMVPVDAQGTLCCTIGRGKKTLHYASAQRGGSSTRAIAVSRIPSSALCPRPARRGDHGQCKSCGARNSRKQVRNSGRTKEPHAKHRQRQQDAMCDDRENEACHHG